MHAPRSIRRMAACGLLVTVLSSGLPAKSTAGEPPQPSGDAPSITPSDTDRPSVRRYLEARRHADEMGRAYFYRTATFAELLAARQQLTTAHIEYAAAAPASRGTVELGEYLARRAEVEALENALAAISGLDVDPQDQAEQKAEIKRYGEAIKAAKKQLARAERAWRAAERKQQFRYLKR